jgi:thioredoxin 1
MSRLLPIALALALAGCDARSGPAAAAGKGALPEVTDQTWDAEVVKSPLPVLVDFHATWCGPCKVLSPVVEEIARENQGTLKVVKCDVDVASATASSHSIRSVPTLVLFKDGKEVRRRVGAGPKADIVKILVP